MIGLLTSANRALSAALNFLAVVAMVTLVVVVLWGVVTRPFGQAKWTEELASFLLIWVSLLGGAIAFRKNDHLGIDYFTGKLHVEVRKGVAISIGCLVLVVTALVFVFGGVRLVMKTIWSEQMTPALGVSMGFVYCVVPLTGVLIFLFGLESVFAMASKPADQLFQDEDTVTGTAPMDDVSNLAKDA